MSGFAFHASGKPRGWVRSLLFDGRTARPYAKRLVFHKSGKPRARFAPFIEGAFDGVQSTEPLVTSNTDYHVIHAEPFPERARLLIYVVYAAENRLSDLHRYQVDCYREAGFSVVLVANSNGEFKCSEQDLSRFVCVLSRPNRGFDFGAWSCAVRSIGGLSNCKEVSFTNDSIIPTSADALRDLLVRSDRRDDDVLFMTNNNELRPHKQSYFFTLRNQAMKGSALDLLSDMTEYTSKWDLINEVEIHLSDHFSALGLTVGAVFDDQDLLDDPSNVTVHRFEEMVERGFPFVKATLVTEGGLDFDDPRLKRVLSIEVLDLLEKHIESRQSSDNDSELKRNIPPTPTSPHAGLLDTHGVQVSWNHHPSSCGILKVPLAQEPGNTALPASSQARVLAIVHCFYVDVAEELLKRLKPLGTGARIVLTTDTQQKVGQLADIADREGMKVIVELHENRGRDVMPFLAACAQHLDHADFVLHLHTKKSPHDHKLSNWGEYLFESLVGSAEIIASNLAILGQKGVGLVHPAHTTTIAGRLNWGFNFPAARDQLEKIGIRITADQVLDFPAGTMFWARPEVLRPLVDLGLCPNDFLPEAGQEDGTLAHAIERSFTYVAESLGYVSVPVVAESKTDLTSGIAMSVRPSELSVLLKRISKLNLRGKRQGSKYFNAVPEVYPVASVPEQTDRPRLNVLIPSLKPEHTFGGISTALKVAMRIYRELGDADIRFVVTSTDIDKASLETAAGLVDCPVLRVRASDIVSGATVISTSSDRYDAIRLRKNDYYFSTAWWTADLAFRLMADQRRMFGKCSPLVYLIQDYEPGFYQWGDTFAGAEATYGRGEETIAIINSEELANFMTEKYRFSSVSRLPFEINQAIASRLTPIPKSKTIFAYGRPNTPRNCFAALVEGLRIWQARDPGANCAWRIVFAGEPFPPQMIDELENASCVGKLSLEDYAALLSETGVGLSLMMSPHPSYPPLELAIAGARVITNDYDHKTMSERNSNIISLPSIAPDRIADALDHATASAPIGKIVAPSEIIRPASNVPEFDPAEVARALRAEN
ncbi:rhamnan synthesis F family protein [Ruegeria sp. Alg231-54]|uniref:rhamnosyltransferase WsaF family glycosyltransferase n=1 Tax=Ruegeria sp. Alg231-54 TaxID=1922221 RepID=UPI000D55B473|nr:rhamnan synthesis F family protein [Ruegeria sp. Alg231-54]